MASFVTQPRKIPKNQQITEPIILHNPHTPSKVSERKWTGNTYRILSIDPAWNNFAIRLEERDLKTNTLKSIIYDKRNFDKNNDYCEVTKYLSQWLDYWKTVHWIIIEKQPPINYATVRQSQHVLTFFLLHLADAPLLPVICEIDTHTKGSVLGYKKKIGDIKKWSIAIAQQILTNGKDVEGLKVLNRFKKQDDLADCVVMIEAFFRYSNLQPQIHYDSVDLL